MANLSSIKLPNNVLYNLKDNGALQLTGGQVTGPVTFGDSVEIDDLTAGQLVVNGNASFTNNIQANTINGVAVGSNPKFTDTNTITTATTTGSGNAVTAITSSNGALTVTKGTTFLTSHQDISGKADKSATVSTVAYDSTNKKITKTINGSTTDVVTVATLKTALGSMPASDVYSWAKASSKPSYSYSEISGTVPTSALPSYVDDVLEYESKSKFPSTGETGKIYVDKATNLTWRWGGSAYVEISPSLALGTTSSTAYRGDYGNTAYNHATDSSRLTTAQSSGLYKIAVTAQGHVASVTAVAKSDITGLGIPAQDTTYTFDGTYNASSNKAATVSTVTNAIAALDVSAQTGAQSKTITSISETDGKISVTYSNISITKSQISDFPTTMTPTEHTHDDRYYTESEINNKFTALTDTTTQINKIKFYSGSFNAGKTYIGWIKIASFALSTYNYIGENSYDFGIYRGYNSPASESYNLKVNTGWGNASIVQLNGKAGSQIIEKFRLVRDNTNHMAYFEVYVNTGYTTNQNNVNLRIQTWNGIELTLLNTVQTEADSAFEIISVIDLKPQGIVSNSNFYGNLTGNVTGNVSGTAANVTGTVAIANGGTGQTTAANAINTLLNGLPVWTADPTDTTYFIRQDIGDAASYGKVAFSTIWNYIGGKLPSWSKASTKPSYTFSEIGSKPTTLSGYGITDAKIANGVITLGSNTITPLTSHQDISGKLDKSGGTMTGQLILSTEGLRYPSEYGYHTDNNGNFIHNKDDSTNCWHLDSYDGTQVIKMYWKSGNIESTGTVTASKFVGANASTTAAGLLPKLDGSTSKFLNGNGTWTVPVYPVTSVNSKTGAVSLTASDVGAATSGHTHALSMATSTGTNSITLSASTKYALTAGGSTYVFTTPPNTTYGAMTTAEAATGVATTARTISADVLAQSTRIVTVTVFDVSSLPCTVNNGGIAANMIVVKSEFSNPAAQQGDWTVDTSAGSFTISGNISGTTNITLYFART